MAEMTKIWGIRAQVITSMVIIMVAAIGFIGVLSLKIIERNAIYRKAREAELLTGFMRHKYGEGNEAFERYIRSSIRSGLISDAIVLNRDGAVAMKTGDLPEDQKGRLIIYEEDLSVRLIGAGLFSITGGKFIVSSDIMDGVKVRFSLPLKGVEEELSGVKKLILYFSIIDSIVIVVLGVYLLSQVVIKPIRKLEYAAKRISGGSFGERADVNEYNEIGSLARSFNTMADSIEEKISHFERANRELVSAQERLLTSQKLATAGRLAAGIAHEIGNPLSAILGYIDLLIKGIDDSGEERDMLKRVEKETIRINNIVKEFLDLSRPSKEYADKLTGAVDVRAVIQDALDIFEPQRREGSIEVVVNLEKKLPFVMADSGKLKQVMLNILMNARDMMPEGGRVTIDANETEYTTGKVSAPRSRKNDSKDSNFMEMREDGEIGKAVCISVSDTGKGIAEEDIDKIFDPFFTTKEPGKGTGLGLFISQEIIQAYGGEIRVKSGEDGGATFEVVLPAAEDSRQ
jgi:hypothetical protein